MFFKGVHRKDKKVKIIFTSIPIPNYAFSKKKHRFFKITSTVSHEKHRLLENKKVFQCKNALKTIPEILDFVYLNQKYAYNTTSESLTKPLKIIKSNGNDQFGGSFGHCVRCGFVVSMVLHEFGDSLSALRINTL